MSKDFSNEDIRIISNALSDRIKAIENSDDFCIDDIPELKRCEELFDFFSKLWTWDIDREPVEAATLSWEKGGRRMKRR